MTTTETYYHLTVLKDSLVSQLNLKPGDTAVDCTAGGGGHTASLLQKVGRDGLVIAFDQDPDAIRFLQHKFAKEVKNGTLIIEQTSFSKLPLIISKHNVNGKIQAIIADLGVSSYQIDTPERGFSFDKKGPLDMRMSYKKDLQTAEDIINNYSQEELIHIFKTYGEEPQAKRISAAIIKARQTKAIKDTKELSSIIKNSLPYKNSKKNPATKVFQALRIYINDELQELNSLLDHSLSYLAPKGRIGIISFHSLEDRIVKHYFQELAGKRKSNPIHRNFPLTQEQINRYNQVKGTIIKPFPIVADDTELKNNPRARSAKLRIIEKIEE